MDLVRRADAAGKKGTQRSMSSLGWMSKGWWPSCERGWEGASAWRRDGEARRLEEGVDAMAGEETAEL